MNQAKVTNQTENDVEDSDKIWQDISLFGSIRVLQNIHNQAACEDFIFK